MQYTMFFRMIQICCSVVWDRVVDVEDKERRCTMRKAFIHILVYINVFFVVLHKRLSVVAKKCLATGFCTGLLTFLLAVSLFVPQPGAEVLTTLPALEYHNTVTNKNTTASIDIQYSEVEQKEAESVSVGESGKREESIDMDRTDNLKKNVVSPGQMMKEDGNNSVVKNSTPLSLVQALYENKGEQPRNSLGNVLYQFPVEIGYAVDANYDGIQTTADYVLNDVFETRPEKEEGEDTQKLTEDEEGQHTFSSKTESDVDKLITSSERFQKSVWNVVLPAEPVERNLSDSEKEARTVVKKTLGETKTQSKKQDSSEGDKQPIERTDDVVDIELYQKEDSKDDADIMEVSGGEDDIEVSDETEQGNDESAVYMADASYFTVKGSMRTGVEAFVGDITIEPTGVDGFDQVRIGQDGEFNSQIILTKDAANEKITLYFSNGSEVTTGVDFTYSKDSVSPALTFNEEGLGRLQGNDKTIYCTNNPELNVFSDDNIDGVQGTGIDKICYVYGDKLLYVMEQSDGTGIKVPEDYYGRILMNCSDKAGNVSEVVSKYYLVENSIPTISIPQDSFCTTPYTLWIDVADEGHIISGIQKVECSINGETYDISDLTLLEKVIIDKGIEVPSKYEFSIPFAEEGEYNVVVTVTDNAGNVAVKEQTITVTKPDLVSVFMPKEFTIHIDPQQLLGREQIFSDEIMLHNNSEFDVRINIKNIELVVKDETSDTGIKKDCNIYLLAPDTKEKIILKKGKNENVYSYCLPQNEQGDKNNLMFVGDTSEGSDTMWKSSDITIHMELEFEKWKDEQED